MCMRYEGGIVNRRKFLKSLGLLAALPFTWRYGGAVESRKRSRFSNANVLDSAQFVKLLDGRLGGCRVPVNYLWI